MNKLAISAKYNFFNLLFNVKDYNFCVKSLYDHACLRKKEKEKEEISMNGAFSRFYFSLKNIYIIHLLRHSKRLYDCIHI